MEESIYTRPYIICFHVPSCSLSLVQYADLYLLEDSKDCIRVLLGLVEERRLGFCGPYGLSCGSFGCRGIWRIFDIYKEVVGGGALEEQEIPIFGFNRI